MRRRALFVISLAMIAACASAVGGVDPTPPPNDNDAAVEAATTYVPGDTDPNPRSIDLGEIDTGKDIAFDIPRGAIGFNIVLEDLPSSMTLVSIGIERIVAPDGTVVHDRYTPAGGSHTTSISLFDRVATASVPQGDGVPANLEGRWTLRAGFPQAPDKRGTLRTTIRIQEADLGTFRGGWLDLHLHVPGYGTTDAGVTRGLSSHDEKCIDRYFELLRDLVGIDRGTVTVYGEDWSLDALTMPKGFALEPPLARGTKGLQVLLTNWIEGRTEDHTINGASPSIPGSAGVFGRNTSGIIVVRSDDFEESALRMLHETGHFFGLNHTVEFDGTLGTDPLADTPSCASHPQLVAGDPFTPPLEVRRQCPDATNVMFAGGPVTEPVRFTPSQLRVLHGSPIYHAAPH